MQNVREYTGFGMSQARISLIEDKNFQQVPWPILPILIEGTDLFSSFLIPTKITFLAVASFGTRAPNKRCGGTKANTQRATSPCLLLPFFHLA